MQVYQIGLEEMLLHIFEAVLVHPQHFELAQRLVLRRTDVDLHMGMVYTLDFLDLERLPHVLAVAHR